MKTESECAEILLKWTTDLLVEAESHYTKIVCIDEGRKQSESTWKEMNPDDGVGSFSSNPYSDNKETKRLIEVGRIELEDARCLLNFVTKRICSQIR